MRGDYNPIRWQLEKFSCRCNGRLSWCGLWLVSSERWGQHPHFSFPCSYRQTGLDQMSSPRDLVYLHCIVPYQRGKNLFCMLRIYGSSLPNSMCIDSLGFFTRKFYADRHDQGDFVSVSVGGDPTKVPCL